MKKFSSLVFATLAVTLTALASLAQAAPAPAPDLGVVMKDMSKQVLQLVENSSDASKNAASAAICDKLLADISVARGVMPDKVQALPPTDQSGQMAAYQHIIDQLSAAVTQMKTDFLNNNNNAVNQDLSQIHSIKEQGHQQFKGN